MVTLTKPKEQTKTSCKMK